MSAVTAKGTGLLALCALWFGAAVSLAEIQTGALFADAGFRTAMIANLSGHLVGAAIFFIVALLSVRRRETAIRLCHSAFGRAGVDLFGALNLIQLVGWTAVMIIVGAQSLNTAGVIFGFDAPWFWRLFLGLAIGVWALLGPKSLGRLNTIAGIALVALALLLTVRIFSPSQAVTAVATVPSYQVPFGLLVELAVIMPLSWLPLVGDYVSDSDKGLRAALVSSLAYLVGSVWMYSIGFSGALRLGTADPVAILGSGLTIPALLIVLLSTVTTAFLDVKSAAISLTSVIPRIGERPAIIAVGLLGLGLALLVPVDRYQDFLGLIGTVFAPLYAVILADTILHGRSPVAAPPVSRAFVAFASWAIGVALYRAILPHNLVCGTTVPVMAAVVIIYLFGSLGVREWKKN